MYLMNNLSISVQKYSEITGLPVSDVSKIIEDSGIKGSKTGEFSYNEFMEVLSRYVEVQTPKMRVIVNAIGKGGVGKTSLLSYNLPFLLAVKGYRVLVVDLDYQMNLSLSCGVDETDDTKGIIPFLMTPQKPLNSIVDHVAKNFDLLRGSSSLGFNEGELAKDLGKKTILNRFFKSNEIKDYDYVFFDTHSAGGEASKYAFRCADMVISPVVPDKYTVNGIGNAFATVSQFNDAFDLNIQYRAVINNYEGKQTHHKKKIEEIVGLAENALYKNWIRKTSEMTGSIERDMPIFAIPGRKSNGYVDLINFTNEFIQDSVYGIAPDWSVELNTEDDSSQEVNV